MLPPLGTALFIGGISAASGIVYYTAYKAAGIGREDGTMAIPKTEAERAAFHERISGKGTTPPARRLGRGQTANDMLPMPPDQGPPLPRAMGLRWPWKK